MHRKIGIIGGLSPESTVTYYEYIIRTYTERFGTYNFPEIVIYSVNFQKYVDWMNARDKKSIADDIIKAAQSLERAGADFGIIATNTMHMVFDEVQAALDMPLLHVIDATAEVVKSKDLSKVGLLGTNLTMTEPFYKDRLAANDITTIVPELSDQEEINRIIFEELVRGLTLDESRKRFLEVIDRLQNRGAQGIILGCTEIPLLISENDCSISLFDTTTIHAEKALQHSISGSQ